MKAKITIGLVLIFSLIYLEGCTIDSNISKQPEISLPTVNVTDNIEQYEVIPIEDGYDFDLIAEDEVNIGELI